MKLLGTLCMLFVVLADRKSAGGQAEKKNSALLR